MGISKAYVFYCGGCGQQEMCIGNKPYAIRILKYLGWLNVGDKWYCSEQCRKEGEGE